MPRQARLDVPEALHHIMVRWGKYEPPAKIRERVLRQVTGLEM